MGEVIDARPDRFLREIREHGDWAKACKNSGLSEIEVELICKNNIKFDRAQVECILQYIEDTLHKTVEESILNLKNLEKNTIKFAHQHAYRNLEARHPSTGTA